MLRHLRKSHPLIKQYYQTCCNFFRSCEIGCFDAEMCWMQKTQAEKAAWSFCLSQVRAAPRNTTHCLRGFNDIINDIIRWSKNIFHKGSQDRLSMTFLGILLPLTLVLGARALWTVGHPRQTLSQRGSCWSFMDFLKRAVDSVLSQPRLVLPKDVFKTVLSALNKVMQWCMWFDRVLFAVFLACLLSVKIWHQDCHEDPGFHWKSFAMLRRWLLPGKSKGHASHSYSLKSLKNCFWPPDFACWGRRWIYSQTWSFASIQQLDCGFSDRRCANDRLQEFCISLYFIDLFDSQDELWQAFLRPADSTHHVLSAANTECLSLPVSGFLGRPGLTQVECAEHST